jgi:hypothetical protein
MVRGLKEGDAAAEPRGPPPPPPPRRRSPLAPAPPPVLYHRAPMARRLFTLLSALSLVLWVRSYWVHDWIAFDAFGRSISLRTSPHVLHLEWTSRPYRTPRWESKPALYRPTLRDFLRPQHDVWKDVSGQPHSYTWLGFSLQPTYHQAPGDPRYDCWFTKVGLPYYFLAVLTGLLPAVQARRWLRRRRRTKLRLCQRCGYDLRATPGRCPECGTSPAVKAA